MNEITLYRPRIPVPAGFADAGMWSVLVNAIFPNAETAESVLLALAYCKARSLDPMKKPVNIVTVWSERLGRNVETIWPGINEHQITASRTHEWAGMDAPVWGPDKTERFTAYRKVKGASERDDFDLTYPDWCSVTVYRIVAGEPRAFTEVAYWNEACARVGRNGAPNAMWRKRPRGQLAKVAKAMALRAAFPEEGAGPTAEEMEGQTLEYADFASADSPPAQHQQESAIAPELRAPPPRDLDELVDQDNMGEHVVPYTIELEGGTWGDFVEPLTRNILRSHTIDEFDEWRLRNQDMLLKMKETKPQLYQLFERNIEAKHQELLAQ